MNWGWFDNKYRKVKEEENSSVDLGELWAAIEPEVDKINAERKNKRRIVFWMFFMGAGILIGGLYFGIYINSTLNYSKSLTKNNNIEKTDFNEIITKSEKSNSKVNTEKELNSIELGTIKKSNKINSKAIGTIEISENNSKTQTRKSLSHFNEKIKSIIIQDKKEDVLLKSNLPTPIEKYEKASHSIKKVHLKKVRKINWSLPELLIIKNPNEEISKTNSNLIKDREKNKDFDKAFGIPTNSKKPIEYSLLYSSGASITSLTIGETANSNSAIRQLNSSSTFGLEALHFGIGINARHNSGIGLQSGIEYMRINEKIELSINSVNNDSIWSVQYYVVNLNNDTLEVRGNVPHEIRTEVDKRFYNNYTIWNVPIVISCLKEAEKWAWGMEAGININVKISTKGKYLLSETEDENLSRISPSKIGLSYHIGMSLQRRLNEKIAISLNPRATYFAKDFTNNAVAPFSKKYSFYGADLRLSYIF